MKNKYPQHPETEAKYVSAVEPSTAQNTKTFREVISHINPIFLYSSGEAATEQVTAGCEGHVENQRSHLPEQSKFLVLLRRGRHRIVTAGYEENVDIMSPSPSCPPSRQWMSNSAQPKSNSAQQPRMDTRHQEHRTPRARVPSHP